MTVFLPIMHCLPILMLAKSPRNTHSDCTIVYIGKGRGCILATPISVGNNYDYAWVWLWNLLVAK